MAPVYPLLTGIGPNGRMAYSVKTLVFLALVAGLSACASPSPRMMGGQKHEIEVAGSRFVIWQKADSVEIYRTSMEMMPHLSEVMSKAAIAVTRTTGCKIRKGSLAGDAALMTAKLACG